MDNASRGPGNESLIDFDSFFWLLEERFGLEAIKIVASEIGLANSGAAEVVDLRRRADGRFDLFCRIEPKAIAHIVLSRGPDGRFTAEEGGFTER